MRKEQKKDKTKLYCHRYILIWAIRINQAALFAKKEPKYVAKNVACNLTSFLACVKKNVFLFFMKICRPT